MANWISPKHTGEYLDGTTQKKIDVFEDRMIGWYLNWAKFLNDCDKWEKKIHEEPADFLHLNLPEDLFLAYHSGFASLHLAFAYFESIAIYKKGEDSYKQSTSFFKYGLKDVFPLLESYCISNEIIYSKLETELYKKGRCGLFHSSIAKKGIVLDDTKDNEEIIRVKKNLQNNLTIYIDKYGFVNTIIEHFKDYIKKLRDADESSIEIKNFNEAWDIIHS